MPQQRQVLVIDGDQGHRASVLGLVESMGAEAVPCDSVEEMLTDCSTGNVRCVIADTETVGLNSLELLRTLRGVNCDLQTILIVSNASIAMAVSAMQAGAITVLEKPCGRQELWDAVRSALQQAATLGERAERFRTIQCRLAGLTDEEKQIMNLLVEGLPNKAIARQQDVSLRTVEARRKQIFLKTGSGSLAELVRMVVESGVYADSGQTNTADPLAAPRTLRSHWLPVDAT